MSPELTSVEEQALRLPQEDREALVERLLRSLHAEALPAMDPDWLAEVERRYQEYKAGHVEGIPADQVFEDIPRELGWSA